MPKIRRRNDKNPALIITGTPVLKWNKRTDKKEAADAADS
ncbi:hypothetical protein SD77_4080 [Bacillus badius]|uniref:Uncharacterized protein n=1 Tax=Bacillus badius TaxID=1455 RepID=A0ABR5AUJ7_BACBA|nr:hypothetical protein SD78_0386 [Bacillus badius]KIL78400.1 hypothetical protein SD77_4080 [Bacillus badius]